jgi:hypothetical protein
VRELGGSVLVIPPAPTQAVWMVWEGETLPDRQLSPSPQPHSSERDQMFSVLNICAVFRGAQPCGSLNVVGATAIVGASAEGATNRRVKCAERYLLGGLILHLPVTNTSAISNKIKKITSGHHSIHRVICITGCAPRKHASSPMEEALS